MKMTQEEILENTRVVIQGLDTLRNEHINYLHGLMSGAGAGGSVGANQERPSDGNMIQERIDSVKKTIDDIELGLSEAQVY